MFYLLYKHICSHSKGDIFTCEDKMLFSHVKISSFRAKAHLVFHWCLYNKAISLKMEVSSALLSLVNRLKFLHNILNNSCRKLLM